MYPNRDLVRSLAIGKTACFMTSIKDPYINKKFFVSHLIKIFKVDEEHWSVYKANFCQCPSDKKCVCHHFNNLFSISDNLDEWFKPYNSTNENMFLKNTLDIPKELTCL
jgi:hypothetical protein